MPLGYNPPTRTLTTTYAVSTSGDRWFQTQNNNASMADQLSTCKTLVGVGATDEEVGSETVASN